MSCSLHIKTGQKTTLDQDSWPLDWLTIMCVKAKNVLDWSPGRSIMPAAVTTVAYIGHLMHHCHWGLTLDSRQAVPPHVLSHMSPQGNTHHMSSLYHFREIFTMSTLSLYPYREMYSCENPSIYPGWEITLFMYFQHRKLLEEIHAVVQSLDISYRHYFLKVCFWICWP